jgi:formate dehydrogenase
MICNQRHTRAIKKMKILLVLYDDPITGYPTQYARETIPHITHYPDGQTVPNPERIDFTPGHLLGSVSGALGLAEFAKQINAKLIVTSDKEGPDSVFEKELPDADIVISQPFWPAYLTKTRLAKANHLKLVITAGIGSDHIDLESASNKKITIAEITFCNSISVAEHIVMMILSLVRNYLPSHEWIRKKGWNIADCVQRSYDLEGMHVGSIGAGHIGLATLRRLQPFDVKLHYTERHRLSPDIEKELGLTYHEKIESLLTICDVVTINCPLHAETQYLFNEHLIEKMKRGSYLINTARGKICDTNAIVKALENGHLAGYAGDVWFPQPPPKDHPWRTMPNEGMTPHISGTSLSAQARYAAGVREILECWITKKQIREEYLIMENGRLAGIGKHSYVLGNTTSGADNR